MAVIVKATPGEPADSLLRKFNKKVANEGILFELKKRERYLKPSARKAEEERQRRKLKRQARSYVSR